MLQLLKDRNFLFYWLGQFVSVIGDHVTMLAFPWLVLQLTGSELLMGLVFAAQGLPRAVLMLWGGALVDRTNPRSVMLWTNILRLIFVMVLSYLLYVDSVTIELVFAIAIAFGLADAFFYPATTSMVPSLVEKDDLQAGNSLVQTTMWLGVIIGPVIAGVVIAGEATTMSHAPAEAGGSYGEDRVGLARAFFVDGLTFAFSFLTLLFVRARGYEKDDEEAGQSMASAIWQGIHWVWSNPTVRLGFIGIAILETFFQAPIFIGLPALADARFEEGAYVYGLEIAAYGTGALLGAMAGGMFKWPRDENVVRVMFLIFTFSGATIGLIVLYPPYWWAMLVFFIAGCGDSYIWVHFTTYLQKATPEKLLGRVMGILMFMAVGLLPIASIIAGFAFEWNLELSLMIASVILVASCLLAAAHPYAKAKPEEVKAGEQDVSQQQEGL
ncbi:MFS transporter [Kordiimonas aestuarii]|uniref:MFS transporter n=1 Tax=Kordiimonas aestuarii TaxID=1005925 RepID=UPI0021CE30B1|nr:MFS transporter [Kordiimonas aestuarii]